MSWDLYKKQPLILIHPANYMVTVAAVSPVDGGIVWWDATYIASQNMPGGQPGSGFAAMLVRGVPEFVESADIWRISPPDDPDWTYVFESPTRDILTLWREYGQYIPSIDKLAQMAKEQVF